MNDDKKRKKNKKKRNKSNRVIDEKAGEGACQEESQVFQGTNGIANNNNNATWTLESESKREGQNSDKSVDVSSVEFKDEQESKDLKQKVHDLELYVSKLEEKLQNTSESKDALQRESADSRSLRTELALLGEQIAKHAILEASTEEEINRLREENKSRIHKEDLAEKEIQRLKDEKNSWLQKKACMEEEIQRLKDEKNSWLQREANTGEEVKRLKDENFQLQKEVEEMKESTEKLLLERRQFTAKMVALQTGMQQLEREATVRARVEHDIAIASTPEPSKRWLRWGSTKDPVAEAAGIAEDSRIQKEAAATIVEKLVTENAELMEKVNELSSIVDQLNQKCSALEETKSRRRKPTERDATETSESTFKENSIDTELTNGIAVKDEARINISNDDVASRFESEIEEVMVSKDLGVREHRENGSSVYDSIETVEEAKQVLLGSVREPGEMVTQNTSEEIVPLSDAPLMGAPIRLFSFFAKYVSGADLVKPKSLAAS